MLPTQVSSLSDCVTCICSNGFLERTSSIQPFLGMSISADRESVRLRRERRSGHLFPYLNWHLLSDPVRASDRPTTSTAEEASTVTLPGEPSLTSSTSPAIQAAALATADGEGRRERAFVGRGNRIYPGWDRISRSRWMKRGGEPGKGGCNITHSPLYAPNFIIRTLNPLSLMQDPSFCCLPHPSSLSFCSGGRRAGPNLPFAITKVYIWPTLERL